MFNDNSIRNPIIKKAAIILGEIIFLSVAISIFNILSSYQAIPKVYVSGIPSEMPGNYKNSIYEALARSVIQNTDNMAQIQNNIASVREDTISIRYSEDLKRYDGSFIVDLSELQQSYLVRVFWSKTNDIANDEPISVQCPQKEDIIYEEFHCENSNINKLVNALPTKIPVQEPLLDEIRQNYPEPDIDPSLVFISLNKSSMYSNKNKSLDYSVVACDDEEIISGSRNIVKDWIISSGFDPDDYKLNFVDGCEDN